MLGGARHNKDSGAFARHGARCCRRDAGRARNQNDAAVETSHCSEEISVRRSSDDAATSALDRPTATAPASRNARALDASTPPLGTIWMCGGGPRRSRVNWGPTALAGKSLMKVAPALQAVFISVEVIPVAVNGTPAPRDASSRSSASTGDTQN